MPSILENLLDLREGVVDVYAHAPTRLSLALNHDWRGVVRNVARTDRSRMGTLRFPVVMAESLLSDEVRAEARPRVCRPTAQPNRHALCIPSRRLEWKVLSANRQGTRAHDGVESSLLRCGQQLMPPANRAGPARPLRDIAHRFLDERPRGATEAALLSHGGDSGTALADHGDSHWRSALVDLKENKCKAMRS
jgi:hypothetical protein